MPSLPTDPDRHRCPPSHTLGCNLNWGKIARGFDKWRKKCNLEFGINDKYTKIGCLNWGKDATWTCSWHLMLETHYQESIGKHRFTWFVGRCIAENKESPSFSLYICIPGRRNKIETGQCSPIHTLSLLIFPCWWLETQTKDTQMHPGLFFTATTSHLSPPVQGCCNETCTK